MARPSTLDKRADLLLSLLVAAGWFAITLYVFWNSWPPDFSSAYFAGHFYAIGDFDGVYAAPTGFFGPDFPQSWKDYAAELGQEKPSIYPFVYPPIWAALAAPLTRILEPFTFFNMFLTAHLAMTAASVFLAYRLVRAALPMIVWTTVSFSVLWFSVISTSAFVHNQFQITVTFLTILALERLIAGKSIAAGAALGVAAAIKLTPATLLLVFLIEKDWRAVVAFIVVGGGLGLASLGIAGIDLHLIFLERLRDISASIAVMKVNYNLEAFAIEIASLLDLAQLDVDPTIRDQAVIEPLWVTVFVRVALVAGTVLVFMRTRALQRAPRLLLRYLGLLLVVTLCAPLAWTHHYLAPLILSPALFLFYTPMRAAVLVFLIGISTNVRVFVLLSEMSVSVHLQMLSGVVTVSILLALLLFAPITRKGGVSMQLQPA